MTLRTTLLCVGLCLTAFSAHAQSAAGVAEHAPADTCLAVASNDVAETCQDFLATRIGQMLSGPDFAPLVDELRRRDMAGPLHLRPAFGFDWSELDDLHAPGGLFIFPLADDKQGAAWVFDGTPSDESSSPLAAAGRYFQSQGFARSTEQRGGAALTIYRPPDDKQDETPRVQFVGNGFYGLANSPEAAAAVLAVEQEASLATSPLWQQTTPGGTVAAPRAGDVSFVLRPMELWELLRRADEARQASSDDTESQPADSNEPERDPLASSRQLGFDGIASAAGRVTFPAQQGRDWGIAAEVLVQRPLDKALRLLKFESGAVPMLPDWIGADVTSTSYWWWDFPTAMKGFGNLFDEANEPGPDGVGLFEDMLDGLRDDPEGVQVDLRRDVFGQLGPGIMNITDRLGPKTEQLPHGDRTLYMAQVRDVDTVAKALADFYRGDDRVTSEQVGEYQVYTVPEGASLFVEGESDSVVSVRALALGEGRMLFGTDEQLLRTTLAGGPEGTRLKDDPNWMTLWDTLRQRQSEGALWGLAQLGHVLEPSYAQATSAPAEKEEEDGSPAGELWRVLLFGTADPEADVPLAAAPPYSRVRTALPATGTALKSSDQGWTLTIDAQRAAP